ncbi:MAG: hypothetical protein IJY25_05440 [Bacilli bacterium]|nr:hypothetical protein [Bacilli bacterium]
MSSRMDRYYKNELVESGRSKKNKSLYKQIEDLDNYTNIEGVATIEKTNEIDISKVKEMLKNRENYKKQKQLRSILEEEKHEIEVIEEEPEEVRNYDINDILSKVKKESNESERHRSLREDQYKDLKSLSRKEKKFDIEKEEAELKELINTIVSNKELNRLKESDDVGLLDELKSDTMVGDAASIKKIMEEEKQKKVEENTMELDKSFYTSSLGFTQRDFEELKNINHNIKKSNKFIIVLLVVLIVLFVGVIAFFLLNK